MSEDGHLVQMANDIGNFFRSQAGREEAVTGILNHIKSYWTPRMREKICTHVGHGGEGLDELPLEAVRRLMAAPAAAAPKPAPGGDAG